MTLIGVRQRFGMALMGAKRLRPPDITTVAMGTASERTYHSARAMTRSTLIAVVDVGPPIGALVLDVNAVSSAVGDGEAKPQGHHDNGDNP